jgi:hypothetical protein
MCKEAVELHFNRVIHTLSVKALLCMYLDYAIRGLVLNTFVYSRWK